MLPDDERLASTELGSLAMPPDGRAVVYVIARGVTTQLLMRTSNCGAAQPLAGTVGAVSPFFSPDGAWVGFFADGKLKKVPIGGGAPVTVCDAADGLGGSWSASGTIVFASATGAALQRVSADGGTPARATELDVSRGEFSHRWPEFLPDGDTVLFTVGTVGEWDEAEIVAQSLTQRQTHDASSRVAPIPAISRRATSRTRMTAPSGSCRSSQTRLALSGTPRAASKASPRQSTARRSLPCRATAATVYQPGVTVVSAALVVVDGACKHRWPRPARLRHAAFIARRPAGPARRGRQRRARVVVRSDCGHVDTTDIRSRQPRADLVAGWPARRLRIEPQRRTQSVCRCRPVADGPAERLTTSESLQVPGSWSPDGQCWHSWSSIRRPAATSGCMQATADRLPFATGPADESAPRFSPDGRWIAYVSNESGQADVYVRASNGSGARTQIVRVGGRNRCGGPTARACTIRSDGRFLIAPLAGAPQPLGVVYDGVGGTRYVRCRWLRHDGRRQSLPDDHERGGRRCAVGVAHHSQLDAVDYFFTVAVSSLAGDRGVRLPRRP